MIRTALIGFGLGGRAFHAPYLAAREEFDLLSVVSSDASKVHAEYPHVRVQAALEDILAQPDIELVVISSPDHLHAEQAIASIEAGKNIVIDKPLATNIEDACRIADAARASKVVVTAFQNRRWDADFRTLKGLVETGQLGRIVHFESHFDRWRPLDPCSWKEARTGGSWQDLGPHLIDQALVLFGLPEAVTADITILREGAPSPDWFHVILHYSGLRVILHGSKLAADHGLRFAVHGTKGSWIKHGLDVQEPQALAGLPLDDPQFGFDQNEGLLTLVGNLAGSIPHPNSRGNYGLFWEALAAAIRKDGTNPVSVEEAIDTMAVLNTAQLASLRRKTEPIVCNDFRRA